MPLQQTTRPGRARVDCLALLRRHAIFGKFGLHHLKRMSALATRQTLAAGETIFKKGDPGAAMLAVCAGTVKITSPSIDGDEARVNLLRAGEIFGEFALFDGHPRTADAMALTDCELAVIKRSDLQTLLQGEPKLALKLVELLGTQLSLANLHFEEAVGLNLPTRVARALLRLADESSSGDGRLKFKQQELAQMVRTTRESVNKALRTWAKRKWIRLERGSIVLIDHSPLMAIARDVDDVSKRPAWRRAGSRRLWT
jgi:CRP/FNR family transcriptional regulator, cyclic AMP receptor protein